MRRNLGFKQENINIELKQLREKHLAPMVKKLEEVIQDEAHKGGTLLLCQMQQFSTWMIL